MADTNFAQRAITMLTEAIDAGDMDQLGKVHFAIKASMTPGDWSNATLVAALEKSSKLLFPR